VDGTGAESCSMTDTGISGYGCGFATRDLGSRLWWRLCINNEALSIQTRKWNILDNFYTTFCATANVDSIIL
jgi:hypothetical protein